MWLHPVFEVSRIGVRTVLGECLVLFGIEGVLKDVHSDVVSKHDMRPHRMDKRVPIEREPENVVHGNSNGALVWLNSWPPSKR